MRAAAVILAIVFLPTSGCAEEWKAMVLRLCYSTVQDQCWIKVGSQLCEGKKRGCRNLDDNTAAKVLRLDGSWLYVETQGGRDYVSGRSIVVSEIP